jgi:hypothetical protein
MLLTLLLADFGTVAWIFLLSFVIVIGGTCVGLFSLGSRLERSKRRSVKAIGNVLQVIALGITGLALIFLFN